MSFSCIRLTKICFLFSVITCTVLLLLIPKFQSSWRFKIYPQPRPSLVFNASNKDETPLQQVEFNSPNPLDAEVDNIVPLTKENILEKWNHYVTDIGGSHLKANGKINKRPHNVIHMKSAEVSAKEKLELKDIFIAVKTTRKYHKTRLNLLLQTWISQAKGQTFVFTDGEDRELHLRAGDHIINTNCSAVHTRQALCCKMSVEYDKFLESGQKWFCHVDDDNYVNLKSLLSLLSAFSHSQDIYIGRPSLDHPIEAADHLRNDGSTTTKFWFATGGAGFCISRGLALKMSPWASLGSFISTAERIRLPDDCTIGYIIEGLLEVKLLHSPLFHSHLENLQQLRGRAVLRQVTLSYGGPENKRNVVSVGEVFSIQQDPTRFKSVHCLLYPETLWCPTVIVK
ncbi:beta-1,3-N-acetylglucosaminyltransferase radical fringe isoform X1 [Crotalus tigris]|uniref:beta-1,3-N-acetylglucosaminyltransferase radical fringe isoform X1 n=1 Tax=Crotalus tigris TaxID=88082 RepID=UPI00192F396A|nr:beta-1,3-N-acetylglucosaminyltransferase radical fringe isoform X1 [Crotalus tigris]XP_039200294.1 beta-1,3-N-acetylglucosaminyltransferase radical fringe isoform X1 [Crotalus tigris]XP_039200303.1 beta-1,3-N-acetylglucosaminyltransferase radical fringe isoform X1 [Crotalus tigris]XP_039200311.1 beta-1,3-N-acetylglucosaminyltransferase radical fringe isoform X1 [Crotalus tigris]XP_039200319.1 beta-1,3-N-acetylglucosaminyltransferase radical fringe isoform X1 [Crotalus tigris]